MLHQQKGQFFLILVLFVTLLTACNNSVNSSTGQNRNIPTATVTSLPTKSLDALVTQGYNFENLKDTQGWVPEEYNLKDSPGGVNCSVTTEKKYAGQSSLEVSTLLSDKTDADRHTKIMVDMSHQAGIPEGYTTTKAHNWTAKKVSMKVWIPSQLANKIKVVIVVADTVWHNDRHVIADPLSPDLTNHWVEFSMIVGASEDKAANTIDTGFDPKTVISVQIWFEVSDSTTNFKGNIYLDNIEVPAE